MKMNRRNFLATGAISATALTFGVRGDALEPDTPIKINKPRIITRLLKNTETIPNSRLPVVIYQGALDLPKDDPAAAIEAMIHANQWGNDWRNGIFSYHHYHSTAHETLLVYGGSAKVQLGGEGGVIETIGAGDVIVIPAGVGHKNLGASSDFHVVGAYPPQQSVDMNYGKAGERPRVDQNIARLALPTTDPIFGKAGPLLEHWQVKS
jgi:uncharacterized protein YjlB